MCWYNSAVFVPWMPADARAAALDDGTRSGSGEAQDEQHLVKLYAILLKRENLGIKFPVVVERPEEAVVTDNVFGFHTSDKVILVAEDAMEILQGQRQ